MREMSGQGAPAQVVNWRTHRSDKATLVGSIPTLCTWTVGAAGSRVYSYKVLELGSTPRQST
jgi:hypothetical protein